MNARAGKSLLYHLVHGTVSCRCGNWSLKTFHWLLTVLRIKFSFLVTKPPAGPSLPFFPLALVTPVLQTPPSLPRLQVSAELLLRPGNALSRCHLLALLCLAEPSRSLSPHHQPPAPQALSRSWWSVFHTLYCSGFQPRVIFTPKEAFGNVQRHLWLSQLGKRVTRAFRGSRPGMLWNSFRAVLPQQWITLSKMSIVLRLKNHYN